MYVVQLAALPHCIDPRRRSTSCDCLHQQLRSTIWMPHIVSGILDHHLKPHMLKPKRTPSHSWSMLQHARRTAPFLIPAIGCLSEHTNQPQVCINSYLRLLSIGRDAKATLNGHAKRNTSVVDWRCGRLSNNAMKSEQTDHFALLFQVIVRNGCSQGNNTIRSYGGCCVYRNARRWRRPPWIAFSYLSARKLYISDTVQNGLEGWVEKCEGWIRDETFGEIFEEDNNTHDLLLLIHDFLETSVSKNCHM
jgi:hypothetical protein